jgi:predicted Zn finger-like uncharacterized protein
MNVSCPQCKTIFRVDPRKIPSDGVRARCSVCGGVFEVLPEDRQAELAAVAAAVPDVPASEAPEQLAPAPDISSPAALDVETVEPEPEALAVDVQEYEEPEPVAAPEPEQATPEPTPVPVAEAPPEIPRSPFGPPDQDARARRLARALISDLSAYHPDRQEQGLKEGRLKELFQDDLRKSWQQYVDQVGLDVAKSTPSFRDALNDILAKGKRVF